MSEETKEIEMFAYIGEGKELWTSNEIFANIRANYYGVFGLPYYNNNQGLVLLFYINTDKEILFNNYIIGNNNFGKKISVSPYNYLAVGSNDIISVYKFNVLDNLSSISFNHDGLSSKDRS